MYSRATGPLPSRGNHPLPKILMIAKINKTEIETNICTERDGFNKKAARHPNTVGPLPRCPVCLVRSLVLVIILLDRTVAASSPAIKRIRIHLPGRLCMAEKAIFKLIGLIGPITAVTS